MNEDLENVSLEPEKPKDKIVKFFSGEGDDAEDIIKRETLTDLVAMSFSLQKTEEEIAEKRKKLNDEIKRQLDADKIARGKTVKAFDERQVILTKKAGRTEIDYEKYITEECSPEAWNELQQVLDEVKGGKVTSKYVKVGKESVSLEII